MIKNGDKIELVKAISVLEDRYIGTQFTVTHVDEETVYFKSSIGVGGMSHDELNKHFKIVEMKEEVDTKVEVKKVYRISLKSKISNLFRGKK